jgi:ferredoxin-NADP reductase
MVAVAAALRTLQVPDSSIHYEQFAWGSFPSA